MDPPPLPLLTLSLLTSTFFFILTTSSSSLDPKQLTALQSMGLPTTHDPCISSSNLIACDSAAPFRHLISLSLTNCSSDLDISSTALRSLSTLRSLSFLNCPNLPQFKHPFPSPLSSSLRSFSCRSSLKHLSGVWLSHLKNLTTLDLVSAPVSASGPFVFLSQMPRLVSATVSNCNLTGKIPHHWHSLNLTHLDFSSNQLKGAVPGSINVLESLQSLNLSSNALTGTLPDTVGDLIFLKNISLSRNLISGSIPDSIKELPELMHLDLSSNQFNGSVPRFLAELKSLRYLNLEDNRFQGVMPFNASFIRRLEVFRVGGNGNLCYNRSLISSKMKLGIAPCDKYGLPVSPPPDKSTKSDSSDYGNGGGDDGDDDGGEGSGKSNGGHHGPNKLVLGVAIGLSCLVFFVIFLVCISKCCS